MFSQYTNIYKIISIVLLMVMGEQSMAGINIIKKGFQSNQTKFDWQASEGSPKKFPMQIIYGSLNYPDTGSLYVPNGVLLHNGWGDGRSSHVVGPDLKSLPDELRISFFSYAEDQFYDAEFNLPYDKILKMFQVGHYSPKDEGHIIYDEITVGIAPGGAVSVWVVSLDRAIEVFFGYAKKVKGNWESINSNPKFLRKDYVRSSIEETLKPEELTFLKKNGIPFGLWEKYHKSRYQWHPKFINMTILDNRIDFIKYFNGEHDYIDMPIKKDNPNETRAVPSEIDFVWTRPNAKSRLVELFFNEDEIFKAFEQLGSHDQELVFVMKIDDKNKFSMTIRNEKKSVELKQTKIKTYAVPE